jgi:hypothetical protein
MAIRKALLTAYWSRLLNIMVFVTGLPDGGGADFKKVVSGNP